MSRVERGVWGLLLCVALGVQWTAIESHSLTGDGAHHLVAGQQALSYGQNRINLEHPPLFKLLIALPSSLVDAPLVARPVRATEMLRVVDEVFARPERTARATRWGRWMALLACVLPFGLCIYALGRRFGDPRAGLLLLTMTMLSFSTAANLTILQTDTAVALGYLLTVLVGLRYCVRPTMPNALLIGLAVGLSMAVKHSGALIVPTALLALGLGARTRAAACAEPGAGTHSDAHRGVRSGIHMAAHLGLVALAAIGLLELSYLAANLDYRPELGREVIRDYTRRGAMVVGQRLLPYEGALLSLESHAPRAAQWLTGLLGIAGQNAQGAYPSFAFGQVSYTGRYWYFPALLWVKTPLAILAAAGALLLARLRSPDARRWPAGLARPTTWFVLCPVVSHLTTAILSNYNLGFRHLIPIVPFLYLPLALRLARRPPVALCLGSVLALECAVLAPTWMSASHTWWLGARDPFQLAFSAGNLDFGQGLRQLGAWATTHRDTPIHVVDPKLGPRRLAAHVPRATLITPGDASAGAPDVLAPGLYVCSLLLEQYLPAAPHLPKGHALRALANRYRPLHRAIMAGHPSLGIVAGVYRVYDLRAGPSPP